MFLEYNQNERMLAERNVPKKDIWDDTSNRSLVRMLRIVFLVFFGLMAAPINLGIGGWCYQPTQLSKVPSSSSSSSHVYVEPSKTLVYDTVSVRAGQALQYRFGLTRDTRLSAQFQVSGGLNNQIQVMLLDEANYQLYQARQHYSIFRGTSGSVRSMGSYTFVIPQTGIYHVLLDNGKAWLMPR